MTTKDMMTLQALLEKSSDADLLREMIGFTAERLMALRWRSLRGPRTASVRRTGSPIATATGTGSGRLVRAQSS